MERVSMFFYFILFSYLQLDMAHLHVKSNLFCSIFKYSVDDSASGIPVLQAV